MNSKAHANLFFDESGFTGNNLLHKGQKIFCYGSVQTTHEEAESLVSHIISKYKIQNGEIKGGKLLKYENGRKAIDEILHTLEGQFKVSVSDKKYALAGKFFEYVFEPALQEKNSIFYNLNFHKFISMLLYLELKTRGAMAEEIFDDFEHLMRNGDFNGLKALFSYSKPTSISPYLNYIADFAIHNKDAVIDELDSLLGTVTGKWILDLTNTALFSLLASWGQHFDELTAYCDQSKPLNDDQEIFNAMIGRKDKVFSSVGGQPSPISFNLKEPLNLVDSKTVHGIQLADAVSAAFVYACTQENTDKYAKKWRKYISDFVISGSIFPEYDCIDINKLETQRNAFLLVELVRRSENKLPLLEDLPNLITSITYGLRYFPVKY